MVIVIGQYTSSKILNKGAAFGQPTVTPILEINMFIKNLCYIQNRMDFS